MIKANRSIRRRPVVRPMFAGLRHYDRKPARLHVTVIDEDGWELPFDSINISESGVFVESQFLYDIGTTHELILRSSDGTHKVHLKGRIVRVESVPAGMGASGMAYQFMHTDRETFHGLTELIAAV